MKYKNNSMEKKNLFSTIKSWFYNLFHNSKENNDEKQNNKIEKSTMHKEQNIFDEYRKKNERHQHLVQLQQKYENKEILEENMSIEDKADLEKLYEEEIIALKRKIRSFEIKLGKS